MLPLPTYNASLAQTCALLKRQALQTLLFLLKILIIFDIYIISFLFFVLNVKEFCIFY